ncbi:hypothetical protein J2X06_000538 [Lysobacter niastensis]|uniref:DUF3016 domain-containing protein n=1 Tax=Lysobacter niastensis TaxID=380629 RepID=A0ABU1W715_9GAMM|nr:DUF3016 domain-containing protein [Lysobacter niastensis]MDR7133354.1 hypothetical protein [Lysobacter niastensis]
MNLRSTLIALALVLTGATVATASGTASARIRTVTGPDAPRALPEQGPVSVTWDDPANFTEIRYSLNKFESRRGDWVEQLAQHLRERAEKRLPPGEQLLVNITDIDRAGAYEPWRGVQFYDTRFILDIYPPRMTFNYRRIGAGGDVLAEGEREIRDMGYLMTANPYFNSDTLRYEKAMIDRWISQELPRPGT